MTRPRHGKRICPSCGSVLHGPHLCQGREDNPGGLRFRETAPLMLLAMDEAQSWRRLSAATELGQAMRFEEVKT